MYFFFFFFFLMDHKKKIQRLFTYLFIYCYGKLKKKMYTHMTVPEVLLLFLCHLGLTKVK